MKKYKTNINAWEPAIWGAIFGSSTITTVDTLVNSELTPDWFKIMIVLITATVAVGSAYKMYQSANKQNEHIQYLKNRQRKR